MENKITIITDSTNDLPQEMRERYDIRVVPLTIVWGNEQFLDGVDMSAEQFYRLLGEKPQHPSTSQPTPGDFSHIYNKAQEDGAEELLVITISGAMSGTIESARSAAVDFPIPVRIVDSKSNSMSLGWQILAAARAREQGVGINEMIQAAEDVRKQLHYHIVLDTLEYLVKGGRVAGAAKFIGNMLNIKPQIRVNHQSGEVEPGDISRTRSRALESLYKGFFNKLDTSGKMHIAVLHNAALDEANLIAERISNEYNPAELIIGIVSPVLGVHTGPRAIALCGYAEE